MTTLLFAHGGGFCRQIWDPIIRRLQVSPLLQSAEFVTFDFPFHGSKRDESVEPQVDENALKVRHPAQDLVPWTTTEVQRQVQLIRGKNTKGTRPKLIGVGHSMGAGALWNAEVRAPGTFDALILFEPVYGITDKATGDKITDFLVTVTLQRQATWATRAEAEQYFGGLKNFSSWDRESLAGYLSGALVEENGETVLACSPKIEASLYCHDVLHFTDEELQQAKCRTFFHYGERTNMLFKPIFDHVVSTHPAVYSLGEPMKKCSHLLVMEDPETASQKILSDLATVSRSSRL